MRVSLLSNNLSVFWSVSGDWHPMFVFSGRRWLEHSKLYRDKEEQPKQCRWQGEAAWWGRVPWQKDFLLTAGIRWGAGWDPAAGQSLQQGGTLEFWKWVPSCEHGELWVCMVLAQVDGWKSLPLTQTQLCWQRFSFNEVLLYSYLSLSLSSTEISHKTW